MQVIKVFLLIFFLQFGLVSNSVARSDRNRNQLLSIINDELKELNRLDRSIGKQSPVRLLRRAELFLEKGRLIREKENEEYLKVSSGVRSKRGKKAYFKKSQKMFIQAQKIAERLLRKFRKFDKKYKVYYILGYNAREFQKYKKSKKYFERVLRYAPKGSVTYLNTKIALAEMYYNDHQYARAIPLYESLLKVTRKSKWHTKYLHNLAWCYFREGKGDIAIIRMKEVYFLSKKSKYVDLSALAEKDLGEFYADGKKTDEAIAFFKKNGKDLIGALLTISQNLQEQGKHKDAAKVLREGKRKAKNVKEKIKITIEILTLYDNFENIKGHYKATEDLFGYYRDGKLSRSDKKVLLYHLKRMSAKLQKDVVDKTKRRKFKARYSVKYFDLLSKVDKRKSYEAIFYSAEVLYAVGMYDEAVERYYRAYNESNKRRNKKIKKLALEGMLSCLGKKKISKKAKKKYLKFGYIAYLKENSQGEKASRIYQRLFETYRKEGNIVQSEQILLEYRAKFPKEVKIQEAMLARVMDYYKKKKDRQGILKWVEKINRRDFVVSKKYANKVRQLLLNMNFEQVEKIVSSGNKKKALDLYLKIYEDSRSGAKEKKNAAYNIAVILYELSYAKKSYQWAKRSLELMKPAEVKKFQSTFALITAEVFGQRLINEAAEMNSIVFRKMCKLKTKYVEVFYKNSVLLYLAENNLVMAENIINEGKNCSVNKRMQRDMDFELLKSLVVLKRWSHVERNIDRLTRNKRNYPRLIDPLHQLEKAYYDTGRKEEVDRIKDKILRYYQYSKSKKMNVPLEALDIVSDLHIVKLRRQVKKLKDIRLEFPEKTYNKRLKAKFLALDKVTTKSLENFSIGSGKGIVETYKILIASYQSVVREIQSFSPSGKSKDYVNSFKKGMRNIVMPLKKKVQEFKIQASNNIKKHNILSVDNYQFLSGSRGDSINIRYFPASRGVLMDKGGRQ